jgi:hypothetical protein
MRICAFGPSIGPLQFSADALSSRGGGQGDNTGFDYCPPFCPLQARLLLSPRGAGTREGELIPIGALHGTPRPWLTGSAVTFVR